MQTRRCLANIANRKRLRFGMAIYYPLYSCEDEWQDHNICEVCHRNAGLDESMRVLVFDANHKCYLCRQCLDRAITAHWNDDENDNDDNDV